MASAAETAILSGRGGWPRILIELALLYALPPTRYRFVIAQCTGGRGWSALPGMEVVKPSDVQLEVAVLASVKSEYRIFRGQAGRQERRDGSESPPVARAALLAGERLA